METSSFYITCPSNASMRYYPENTQASFKINLPKRLYLHGQYEVGLAEIQYPVNWLTFSKARCEHCFIQNGLTKYKAYMKHARYNTVDEILHVLTTQINTASQANGIKRSGIILNLERFTNRVHYSLDDQVKLILTPELNEALGFLPNQSLVGEGSAIYPPDAFRGFNSLYVYCNVVDSQIVGDVFAPLLRTVAVSGERGSVVTATFDRPHYVPVSTDEVGMLEINIKDDTGDDVSFQFGKVIVKLHFRQKSI